DIVAEISAASDEQTRGISQINTATLQINESTQANSQQSEELASTAEEMSHLSVNMQREVAQFRLRGHLSDQAQPPALPAARHTSAKTANGHGNGAGRIPVL
ncbi:hypothetical protein V6O07_15180, partial [Arthrospira platensis SPKY2]